MPNYKDIGQSLGRSRTTARIPAITNEHINTFSGAAISNRSGMLKNCTTMRYGGEEDRPPERLHSFCSVPLFARSARSACSTV